MADAQAAVMPGDYSSISGSSKFGRLVNAGGFLPTNVTSDFGSASFGPTGFSGSTQFDPLAGMFGGAAQGALTQAPAFDVSSLLSGFGAQGAGELGLGQGFTGLAGLFGSQLAGYDQNAAAGNFYGLMNDIAGGADTTAANQLANRLFSGGRLGANDTTAGRAFGDLSLAQNQARDSRLLSAFGLASNNANQLANFAQGFGSLGTNLTSGALQNIFSGATLPQNIFGTNITNAVNATSGINAALSPYQAMIQNLFAGSGAINNVSQNQFAQFANRLNANKVSGSGPGALESAVSGALSGFGQGFGQGGMGMFGNTGTPT